MLSTGHFYSGEVRYIGYVYAEIASDLVYQTVMHTLMRQTGRLSLYQQPKLGPILQQSLYNFGATAKFPKVIEEVTEQPFAADAQAVRFNKAVLNYLRGPRSVLPEADCRLLLN
jgi:hypothetical protein